MFPTAIDLTKEGLRTVRERFAFHFLAAFLCFLPTLIYQLAVGSRRTDDLIALIPAMVSGDTATMLSLSARMQENAWMDWAATPVVLVCMTMLTLVSAKSALDQHRGLRPSLLETAKGSVRGLPWLILLDVPAALVTYMGMVCCCFPGIAMVLVYVAYLAYLPTVLVEERLNLFQAIPRSAALSRGNRDAQLGVFGLFVLVSIVLAAALILVSILVGVLLAGETASTVTVVQEVAHVYLRASQIFGFLFWLPWIVFQHARVAAYVHMARMANVSTLADVFR